MPKSRLRVGIIGAGANTRTRHIPGFRAIPEVDLVAVCNRRPESTAAAATEYGIRRSCDRWQDVVSAPDVDAVLVGTWPYMHCPIVIACLDAGKHVLTEARLSMNADEAHRMLQASRRHPDLVAQVVPSPFGLRGHDFMRELIRSGFIGELREARVYSLNNALGDVDSPLSWRQDLALSGFNMLTLGIIHETFLRWAPPPARVIAQVHAFVPSRIDPESGVRRSVGTPDSVQALVILQNGARALYQFSGVAAYGQGAGIWLHGSEGVLHYDLLTDRIRGASRRSGSGPIQADALPEIPIPESRARQWQVEADFVRSIQDGTPVELTDFRTGVAYMEFTEAVARSAAGTGPVDLPLEEYSELSP